METREEIEAWALVISMGSGILELSPACGYPKCASSLIRLCVLKRQRAKESELAARSRRKAFAPAICSHVAA